MMMGRSRQAWVYESLWVGLNVSITSVKDLGWRAEVN
jgi:hypothetical protein